MALLPQESRAGTAGHGAGDGTGADATGGAADAAESAFPVQHASHDLGPDPGESGGRRSHCGAPERIVAGEPGPIRHAGGAFATGVVLSGPLPGNRAGALSGPAVRRAAGGTAAA